jgi:hypothetical protein
MRCSKTGQSLTETLILTAATAAGILGLCAVCGERIAHLIDLILTLIASPVP